MAFRYVAIAPGGEQVHGAIDVASESQATRAVGRQLPGREPAPGTPLAAGRGARPEPVLGQEADLDYVLCDSLRRCWSPACR